MPSEERAIEPLWLDEREDRENAEVNNVAAVELGTKPRGPRRQEGIGEIGPCYAGNYIVHIRWRKSKIEMSGVSSVSQCCSRLLQFCDVVRVFVEF